MEGNLSLFWQVACTQTLKYTVEIGSCFLWPNFLKETARSAIKKENQIFLIFKEIQSGALKYVVDIGSCFLWPNFLKETGRSAIKKKIKFSSYLKSLAYFVPFIHSIAYSVPFSIYTDKKDNQIFLIYKEIQSGAVAKSYMRKDFLIY
jgi:hypothetical protein